MTEDQRIVGAAQHVEHSGVSETWIEATAISVSPIVIASEAKQSIVSMQVWIASSLRSSQ